MALMRWDCFQAAHPRPQMIFANLDGARSQARFDLLRRMIQTMVLPGSYALHPQEGLIRVAVERDADALKFAAGVQARRTAREGGWAGQWAFLYDDKVARAYLDCKQRQADLAAFVRGG